MAEIADQFETAFVEQDVCPKCLGELDTGWECTKCGFDAMPIARPDAPVPLK